MSAREATGGLRPPHPPGFIAKKHPGRQVAERAGGLAATCLPFMRRDGARVASPQSPVLPRDKSGLPQNCRLANPPSRCYPKPNPQSGTF